MKFRDVTALGRPIDPAYPTNLAIAGLSAVVVVVATLVRLVGGATFLEGAVWGIGAGLAVFLTWALARELDPDHDLSAFAGVGLMGVGLFFVDLPSLLVLFWLLLALRMVNRSVGLPARPLDSLAVLGLGGWLTWQGYWMAGLMTAIVFLLDGVLSRPLRYHLGMAGLAMLVTFVLAVFHGNLAMESGLATPMVVMVVVALGLFLYVIATSRSVEAVGDATGEPLDARRVQATQGIALLTGLLLAWWDGTSGVVAVLPLWAAGVGIALYRLVRQILSRGR
jgi:hypothetical protein